jgi:hypothetical protein
MRDWLVRGKDDSIGYRNIIYNIPRVNIEKGTMNLHTHKHTHMHIHTHTHTHTHTHKTDLRKRHL